MLVLYPWTPHCQGRCSIQAEAKQSWLVTGDCADEVMIGTLRLAQLVIGRTSDALANKPYDLEPNIRYILGTFPLWKKRHLNAAFPGVALSPPGRFDLLISLHHHRAHHLLSLGALL